jgi:hypothetical protein
MERRMEAGRHQLNNLTSENPGEQMRLFGGPAANRKARKAKHDKDEKNPGLKRKCKFRLRPAAGLCGFGVV